MVPDSDVNWRVPPANEIGPVVPKAAGLPSDSVPAARLAPPEKVFDPVSVTVPDPSWTTVPLPLIRPP